MMRPAIRSCTTDDRSPYPFGYKAQAGYYTDSETGLILCTYRYYDPTVGRWLTRDPDGYDGGMDLYAYCMNDPVNGTWFPFGLDGQQAGQFNTFGEKSGEITG